MKRNPVQSMSPDSNMDVDSAGFSTVRCLKASRLCCRAFIPIDE